MYNAVFTYFIAFVSGLLGVLAFSPFDYWFAAYFSVLGLLFVVKNPHKATALWAAFLWGIAFFSFGVHWLYVSIYQFGGAPLWLSYFLVLLLAAYLALYPLLFAYVIQRFQVQSAVLFPVIWTATEWLRGTLFTGFPWLQFGYTQIDSPFMGLAPIFGVTGLTFFVFWASAILLTLLRHLFSVHKMPLLILFNSGLLLIIGGLSYLSGKISYVQPLPEQSLRFSLAQGNIAQQLKWDPDYLFRTLDIYQQQIQQHLGSSDVIILPEAAFPTLENNLQSFLASLDQVATQAETALLLGTIYQQPTNNSLFNSIVYLGDSNQPYREDTAQRYNKHHLVPFGEYVPLEKFLRPLGSIFNLPMSAFQSGEKKQPHLRVKGRNIAAAICYEIIFPEQVRAQVQKDTDFILTVSNDAWFGSSIGPWQHLQMARMRALELGKPLLRSTNTGLTVFINERGQIEAQAPQFVQTTLTARLSPTQGQTPYFALGNLPLYMLSLFFVLMRGGVSLLKRRLIK